MKIPKKVLNAMLLGLSVGNLTACSLIESDLPETSHEHNEQCGETCVENGENYPCPACGMG